MTQPEFLAAAALYCMATGGSVTSWIRSPKRNAAVGGTPSSSHLSGMAVDVVYDASPGDIDPKQAIAKKLGLYVYREPDHDHIRPL